LTSVKHFIPKLDRLSFGGMLRTCGNTEVQAMKNENSSTVASRIIIAAGAGAFVAGVIAVAALIAAPQQAQALPAYAAKEGKPCGYCHVNPAGGGPRNARGKQYQANGHTFKK
jgi:hypothetical protein